MIRGVEKEKEIYLPLENLGKISLSYLPKTINVYMEYSHSTVENKASIFSFPPIEAQMLQYHHNVEQIPEYLVVSNTCEK